MQIVNYRDCGNGRVEVVRRGKGTEQQVRIQPPHQVATDYDLTGGFAVQGRQLIEPPDGEHAAQDAPQTDGEIIGGGKYAEAFHIGGVQRGQLVVARFRSQKNELALRSHQGEMAHELQSHHLGAAVLAPRQNRGEVHRHPPQGG